MEEVQEERQDEVEDQEGHQRAPWVVRSTGARRASAQPTTPLRQAMPMQAERARTRILTLYEARAGEGFGAAQFAIDWERERAICPQGRASRIWKPTRDSAGHDIINIRFDSADCRDCPARQRCVSSDRERALAIHPRPLYEALHDARQRQHTPAFREQYHARAGSKAPSPRA